VNIPLGIIVATLLVAFLFCLRGFRSMTLEQWSVGGRGFGTIFVFLLLAGEIYTTFTFLGGSGWAYGRGAPAFYIISYGTIAYIMSYWLLPAIWKRGTEWKVLSQPEFFERAYQSPALGKLVAVVCIAALIPYLVLQLTAANAALKDILVLVAVVGLGIALPFQHFGGIGPMFDRVIEAKPTFLLLPESGQSKSWFISTVALTAMGFYMWPHTFGSVFSAKNAQVFRRNAALMPLYQLILLFVFFIGFAALLTVPGLTGSDVDLSLLRIVRATYGPWIVGFVGAAGLLTALVPGSMILMSSATMLARLFKGDGASASSDSLRTARLLVPVVAAVALVFTFYGGGTLVAMLLMGYSMVTQLFPSLVMALWKGRAVSATAAVAGIVVGELTVAVMTLSKSTLATLLPSFPHAVTDLNVGVVAMVFNVVTMLLVHVVTRGSRIGASTPALQE
jgi:solute:Na+ symporter, SSS family